MYWGWTSTSYLKNWIFGCLFKSFANDEIFQDNPSSLPNYVLDDAMDIPREVVLPIENNFLAW